MSKFVFERFIKSILEKSNLKSLTKLSRMQPEENLNFNKLINLPGQVTAEEQSTVRYFFFVNVETIQIILTGFQQYLTISKQEQNLKLSKLIRGEKDTKVYVKKRAIMSDTSSNSNKNEECDGEKEEVNFDFTVDESCSADKNIPCDLYKNAEGVEILQKELIAYKAELIQRNEDIYKLREENNLLKTIKFSYEYSKKIRWQNFIFYRT